MPVETRQSEKSSPDVVTSQIDHIRGIHESYLALLTNADKLGVGEDTSLSAPGLTSNFLEYLSRTTGQLQALGLKLPVVPLAGRQITPIGTGGIYEAKAVWNHFTNRNNEPFVEPYFDTASNKVYTLSDKTPTLYKKHKLLVPQTDEFIGVASIDRQIRNGTLPCHGNGKMRVDPEGNAVMQEESFTVHIENIDGIDHLMTVDEIICVIDELDRMVASGQDKSIKDPLDISFDKRVSDILQIVEDNRDITRSTLGQSLAKLTRLIEKARYPKNPMHIHDYDAKEVFNGKPVYFRPTTGQFTTADGLDISSEAYLSIAMDGLDYLLSFIPESSRPKELLETSLIA